MIVSSASSYARTVTIYCLYRYPFLDLPTIISCPVSESRASTVCVDLDAFGSEFSRSSDYQASVAPVVVDREGVSSVDFGDDVQSDVSMVLSRFQPLNRPYSPVDISSDSQVVVESPRLYETPAEPLDMSTFVDMVAKLF